MKPESVQVPFPEVWETIVAMNSAKTELLKVMLESDVDRVCEWAENRSMNASSYIASLEFAYQSILDGFSIEEILAA